MMKKQPIHTAAQETDIYVDAWNLVFNVLLFGFLLVVIYTGRAKKMHPKLIE